MTLGLALVDIPHNQTGTVLTAHHPTGRRDIEVADLPFCGPGRRRESEAVRLGRIDG